jgi:hypothetical protein
MAYFDDFNFSDDAPESDEPFGQPEEAQTGLQNDYDSSRDVFYDQNNGEPPYKVPDLSSITDDLATEIWSSVELYGIDPYVALSKTFDIEIHGTPLHDMSLWDPQDDMNSCAVASTNMLFRSLGVDVGESVIAEFFNGMGIYDPAFGTKTYLIDDTLNFVAEIANLDIRAFEATGFDTNDLSEMLDKNIRPLICVDAYELYGDSELTLNELFLIPDAGHAVQLTGIVHTPENSFAYINDPGIPDGAGQKIALDKFMNAAADYGYKAIYIT